MQNRDLKALKDAKLKAAEIYNELHDLEKATDVPDYELDRPSRKMEDSEASYGITFNQTAVYQRMIGERPDGLKGMVIHYLASRPHDGAQDAISGLVGNWAYITVDHDGKIYLPSNFSFLSWGYHTGKVKEKFQGSKYTLGVEVVNPGRLELQEDGYCYPWYNQKMNPNGDRWHKNNCRYAERSHNVQPGWYLPFTNKQEEALVNLALYLDNKFEEFSLDCVWGHDEICDPTGRKSDPGGALSVTMPELREHLKAIKAKL